MRRSVIAIVLAVASAAVAGCGGGGDEALLPSSRASSMVDELDRVERAVRRGACEHLGGRIESLQTEVNGLSSEVDADLRARLQEGVNNLAAISADACLSRQDEPDPVVPDPVDPPPVETEIEPTETDTTQPTETDTQPTETQPSEPQEPSTETTPAPPPTTTPDESGGATVPQTPQDSGATGGAETQP